VLVYCSKGYCSSKNCMRELISAVHMGKPIVPLLEPDVSRGGLSVKEVRGQLIDAEQKYTEWGFGEGTPRGDALCDALFLCEPIVFDRMGPSQDVTVRLIADQLLPEAVRGTTYLRGELSRRRPTPALLPAGSYHVFCSSHNLGVLELISEIQETLQITITTTSDMNELSACQHFLVLLDARTWNGNANDVAVFAAQVTQAMDANVPLLLCHEMPSALVDKDHAIDFGDFFSHTPKKLLKRGIYSTIAIPLKAGPWRMIGIVQLAEALSSRSGWCRAIAERAGACSAAVLRVLASAKVHRRANTPLSDADDDTSQLEMKDVGGSSRI